jgi:Ran GTPase-activating protein (RanGAP) involved in mRNA processing and transport
MWFWWPAVARGHSRIDCLGIEDDWPTYGLIRARSIEDLILRRMWRAVQEVDLRGNNFKDNGSMIIARSLKQMQNSNLKRLDLGYNEIEDDGGFTLANVRPRGWGMLLLALRM